MVHGRPITCFNGGTALVRAFAVFECPNVQRHAIGMAGSAPSGPGQAADSLRGSARKAIGECDHSPKCQVSLAKRDSWGTIRAGRTEWRWADAEPIRRRAGGD